METVLSELQAAAAAIDQAHDTATDCDAVDRDMLLAIAKQLDSAAAAVRLAIGIVHRSQTKQHWAIK